MEHLLHNENELLILTAGGDIASFTQLVVHYRPRLLTFIVPVTRSRERAEEIVQDVFVQIWSTRESLPDIRNFGGFLYVIAKNLALNALRDAMREKLRVRKWSAENSETFTLPADTMQRDLRILDEAVAQLPPQQKRAWVATRQEGKKIAEVAREMGLSVTSVKKYIQLSNKSITAYILDKGDLLLLIALFWKK